jgi:hypothetical protein
MNYKEFKITTPRCKTVFKKKAITPDEADDLYSKIMEITEWEEGIRSKKGFTRKAKAIGPEDEDYSFVWDVIDKVLSEMSTTPYFLNGIYLNYYENGKMWTPNHSHKGTHQLVISLGQTRKLIVGKKEYPMKNGDAILFGSTVHGVPKDESTKSRISIATFMTPFGILEPLNLYQ